MSVMTHSFVPLLLRDKEHPMHNWHTRLSIDTMKTLSPAARTLKPIRIRSNRWSHRHHFIRLYSLIVHVDSGMSCTLNKMSVNFLEQNSPHIVWYPKFRQRNQVLPPIVPLGPIHPLGHYLSRATIIAGGGLLARVIVVCCVLCVACCVLCVACCVLCVVCVGVSSHYLATNEKLNWHFSRVQICGAYYTKSGFIYNVCVRKRINRVLYNVRLAHVIYKTVLYIMCFYWNIYL